MDTEQYRAQRILLRAEVETARSAHKNIAAQWAGDKLAVKSVQDLAEKKKKGGSKAALDEATSVEASTRTLCANAAKALKTAEMALFMIEKEIDAATQAGEYIPNEQEAAATVKLQRLHAHRVQQNNAKKDQERLDKAQAEKVAAEKTAMEKEKLTMEEERKKAAAEKSRVEEAEKLQLEEETRDKVAAERSRLEEEARKKAAAAEEAERSRLEEEEARKMSGADEAERLRLEEETRKNSTADEAERLRLEEETRKNSTADEAERLRLEEETRKKSAADEAERMRLEEETRKKSAADEVERLRLEEEAREQVAKDEAERLRTEGNDAPGGLVTGIEKVARLMQELEQRERDLAERELALQARSTKATGSRSARSASKKALHKAEEREQMKKEKAEERERLLLAVEANREKKRKRPQQGTSGDATDVVDGEHEPEGQRQPKKAKDLPIKELYLAMSEEEQKALRAEGRRHLLKFVKDPDEYSVPFKFRRLIREVQDFLPEASRLCRELALHCLETRAGNFICPYHSEKDKTGAIFDGAPDCKYEVTGVPHQRNVKGPEDEEVPERHDGYLHCGCPEDDVLMDFQWWKGSAVRSPVTNKLEGLRDQRLDPRMRMFMYENWCGSTCQTVHDMFRGVHPKETHKIDAYRARIKAIQAELDIAVEEEKARRKKKN